MVEGIIKPVLAGLVLAVAFIVIVSLLMGSIAPANEQIIVLANDKPEAKSFLAKYPDGKVQIDRTGNEFERDAVKYSYEKMYDDGQIQEIRMFMKLGTLTDRPSSDIYLDCATYSLNGGAMTVSAYGSTILEQLQATK